VYDLIPSGGVGGQFNYTITIDPADVAISEGTFTIVVRSVNAVGTRYGNPASIQIDVDNTPPDAPSGLHGVAF
jgi:hypothetical protein